MFTPEERESVRTRLLAAAERDERIVAAALTGSGAAAVEDHWSDIDLAFSIDDSADRAAVIVDWTASMEREYQAVHYWDLRFGESLFRVFLIPSGLEVDISFTPAAAFGPYGPNFKLVFGASTDARTTGPANTRLMIGIAWHHALHARAAIERGRPWQALHLISGLRDNAFALAGTRLGLPTTAARGVDALPLSLKTRLQQSLVDSLDPGALRRALSVCVDAFTDELRQHDASLAAALSAALGPAVAPRP
jgi:hypothetical protein